MRGGDREARSQPCVSLENGSGPAHGGTSESADTPLILLLLASQHFLLRCEVTRPAIVLANLLFRLDKADMSKRNEQDPVVSQQPSGADISDKSSDLWYSLVHWNDLPHWQQDNHHIHGSYRRASYSYTRSLKSVLHWHNESVNIWTHLVPATLSLPCGAMLYKILKPRYELASAADVLAMGCFFIGATVCLGMSATYHAVSNHSPPVAKMWNQFDYAGISLLIAGSFIPSVYYGFWCNPLRQWTYWTMVSQPCSGQVLLLTHSIRSALWAWLAQQHPCFRDSALLPGDLTEPSCLSAWVYLLSFPSWMV